jgi:D-serine deaminase-like pyridoxal phosphate-dependent protein
MKITKPTLLIDKEKCLKNIKQMSGKASKSNVNFRPHFKTHHSAEIGNWFREFGVNSCTVSSVDMAIYFAKNGWDDITIAFPFNPLEASEVDFLASKIRLNILIESEESLQLAKERISNPLQFFIKIDVGTHRTGVDPNDSLLIEKLIKGSNGTIQFKGFLAHAGHTYSSTNHESIRSIFESSINQLRKLKEKYVGYLSYGDTPSCSVMEDFSMLDEIRPGNFTFYDWMQKNISSCEIEQIAVCMACPIVAIHEDRNEIVVFGGGVHLSKDMVVEDGMACFGKAIQLTDAGWDSEIIGSVKKLSQEHGIISVSNETIQSLKVGDLIGVIPVHSCLAADLQGHYLSTAGERIEKILKN